MLGIRRIILHEWVWRRCAPKTNQNGVLQQPEMICIAGLPGSGKTTFAKSRGFFGKYVMIDPDLYRKYCPHYSNLRGDEVVSATAEFTTDVSHYLIHRAMKSGRSLAILSTFTETEFWESFFSRVSGTLEKKGYRISLILLSQPKAECIRGMQLREKHSTEEEPIPRAADRVFFDKKAEAYDRLLHFDSPLIKWFDEIEVLGRDMLEEEYHSVRKKQCAAR